MVRVYTLSNLVLVHFAENFSLCSKCFQSSYWSKVGFPSLPSPSPFIPFFCSRPNFLDALARKRLLRRLRKLLQNALSLFKQNGPLSSVETNLAPRAFPYKGPFPARPSQFFKGKALGTRLRGGLFVGRLGPGRRKTESARSTMGKGLKREEASLFPLPIVPRGLLIFRCIAIFIGIPSGSLGGGERKRPVSLCEYLCFFFIFIGCLSPLGMKSRFIKDGQISASSSMSDLQLPSAGRLHNTA